MHSTDPFDLILCNPPYYEGYSPAADDRVGVAKHSNELRFQELVEAVERLLAPGGRLAVIVPLNREADLLTVADRIGLAPKRRCSVRYVSHRPAKRVLQELDASGDPVVEEHLTLEATGPFDYSPEYRALISDLMLNF